MADKCLLKITKLVHLMQDETSFGTYSYRVYEEMLNRLRNMKDTPRNFFSFIFRRVR